MTEAGGGDRHPTVLLVEDDESIRTMVRFNLELAAFSVVEAGDGLEGLLMADLHRPDVVVLDLMMPDVDGVRMLGQLRGLPEGGDVPVVIITGKADVGPEVRELVGEGNFFTKPFDPDDLVARVRDLTGG
ncbi:MAG: response regulator [Actinobacteria bacterium]|nr:response regulator [Actinomycetota bacterium]